jgi:hypothetical protein
MATRELSFVFAPKSVDLLKSAKGTSLAAERYQKLVATSGLGVFVSPDYLKRLY